MIPFEKITLISETKNNQVWLASAQGFETPVIIKEAANANRELLERIASIDNVHLPHILSIESADDKTIIMEEYIDGFSFTQYIKENHLTEKEIVSLLLQICDGLYALHSQKPPIIHRDLKPSNLMVSSDGIVKIIDFDASREYKKEANTDTRYLGTAEYAPPEQYGYSQTDVRSDIYSLGAVMYEIFFEKQLPKITDNSALDTARMLHAKQKIHTELIHIIEKCTMFNPSARYQNVKELQSALQHYSNIGKKRLLIRCASVLLILALLTGAVTFGQKFSASSTTESSSQPAATPYNGTVKEAYIDSFNDRTNTSVTFTYYYMPSQPELTPIHIASGLLDTHTVQAVYLQPQAKYTKIEIDKKYWSFDENHLVTISDEYLSTLKTDSTYEVLLDCTDLLVITQLTIIDSLDKVAYPFTHLTLAPGNTEYLHDHPGDIVLAITNAFGRKITKIIDADTGQEVDSNYYEIDEENGCLIIRQSLFDQAAGGSYINWQYFYTELDGFDDGNNQYYSFTVRDHAYIAPKLEKSSFICSYDHLEDLVCPITWNDAKGKLAGIYPVNEKNSPAVTDEEYQVTDSSIILKKEFLQKLSAGTYTYSLEFDDIALQLNITIK